MNVIFDVLLLNEIIRTTVDIDMSSVNLIIVYINVNFIILIIGLWLCEAMPLFLVNFEDLEIRDPICTVLFSLRRF